MQQYHINLEIRNKEGGLFKHPRGHGMFTGFKFDQEYKSYEAMEALFKLMHEELKMLMPDNQFYITASLKNTISDTWSEMASLYGPENRFVIFT